MSASASVGVTKTMASASAFVRGSPTHCGQTGVVALVRVDGEPWVGECRAPVDDLFGLVEWHKLGDGNAGEECQKGGEQGQSLAERGKWQTRQRPGERHLVTKPLTKRAIKRRRQDEIGGRS